MNRLIQKNYKALIIGAIITLGLAILLVGLDVLIWDSTHVSIPYIAFNILGFIFWWFLFSFLTSKYSVYKILSVLGLLVVAIIADRLMDFQANPVTIPLLLLFWLGVAYLVVPEFFKKYQILILSIYGAIIAYFFIFRMMPDYYENRHQNFLLFSLLPLPVFAGLWMYEQWRWLKTLEADKGKAELALLKSQINPHFFFNTLNNLYGLVMEKSEKAPEVVLKLSDMMRYTIYEGKEDLVLLKDEISYLENYIELHKIRFQKKVDIQFTHTIEEGLKVAPLLFINFLENAFKHGAEKMLEHAFIHLQMLSKGNKVFFTIENNFDDTTKSQKNGIGLENLKKRLDYLYPEKYELVIDEKRTTYKVQLNLEL